MTSPYDGLSSDQWGAKTRQLIADYPLDSAELYEVVLKAWEDIFQSSIGRRPFRIGVDIFPRPQIMGYFLHELIVLELIYRYPNLWRREQMPYDKDLVYIPDAGYSIELKTSSSPRSIFGNRSYAQTRLAEKKNKSGYYLAINFQKFVPGIPRPEITLVQFGWLDHEDWQGQTAATGQQARLSLEVERYKLLVLPLVE